MKKKEMIKRKNHIKQGFFDACKTWLSPWDHEIQLYLAAVSLRGAANPGLGHLIGDHDGHGLRNLGSISQPALMWDTRYDTFL